MIITKYLLNKPINISPSIFSIMHLDPYEYDHDLNTSIIKYTEYLKNNVSKH